MKLQSVESIPQREEEIGHVHKKTSIHLHLLLGHRQKIFIFKLTEPLCSSS